MRMAQYANDWVEENIADYFEPGSAINPFTIVPVNTVLFIAEITYLHCLIKHITFCSDMFWQSD